MMKPRFLQNAVIAVTTTAVVFTAGWFMGDSGRSLEGISTAEAAGGTVTDPNGTAPDRYV